jgi:sigma-E processing peptidase SpoIIGA
MLQVRFYWDVFFFLNTIMNLYLLFMTALLRRKTVKFIRMFLAALLGSGEITVLAVVCLMAVRSVSKGVLLVLPVAVLLAAQMLRVCFGTQSKEEKWRTFGVFFKISVLTGGSLLLCREWLGRKVFSGIGMILAGTLLCTLVFVLLHRRMVADENQSHVMDAELFDAKGGRYPVRALVDTGNHLVSPYSGEKVAILQESLGQEMGLTSGAAPLWIPFHSIGGDGLLPAYRIPSLILSNGEEKRDCLAALSSDLSKDASIKLILYSEK